MTVWLLDASVLLAAEDTEDQNHSAAIRLLGCDDPLATLDLAFYEVTNVAVAAWKDQSAANRLRQTVAALAEDGGLVRADLDLAAEAATLAAEHHISVYDSAYVAATQRRGAQLVSCDVRDLVSRGLAVLPSEAGPPESLEPSDQPA